MTSVAYATDQELSTSVDVLISLKETVTVTATLLTHSAYVVATVLLTLTRTEYVMTRTTVLERTTSVEYVTVLELSTNVVVLISQRETVTVMVTSLML